jgi:hypothetical protein
MPVLGMSLTCCNLAWTSQVSTPANWQNGQDCFVLPSMSSEMAKKCFPHGVSEMKPYYRVTPQPDVPI